MCIDDISKLCNIQKILRLPFGARHSPSQNKVFKSGRPKPTIHSVKIRTRNSNDESYVDDKFYEKTNWIAGCSSLQKIYCWPCLLFHGFETDRASAGFNDNSVSAFMQERINSHREKHYHIEALLSYIGLDKKYSSKANVTPALQDNSDTECLIIDDDSSDSVQSVEPEIKDKEEKNSPSKVENYVRAQETGEQIRNVVQSRRKSSNNGDTSSKTQRTKKPDKNIKKSSNNGDTSSKIQRTNKPDKNIQSTSRSTSHSRVSSCSTKLINNKRKRSTELPPYKCVPCNLKFTKKCNLQTHNARSHPAANEKLKSKCKTTSHCCIACKKCHSTADQLNVHIRTNHFGSDPRVIKKTISENTFVLECSICPLTFTYPTSIMRHYDKIHHIRSPITCKYCSSKFSYFSSYNNHCRSEHGTLAYSCNLCTYSFDTFNKFGQHYEAIHSVQSKYECPICSKKFKTENFLEKHIAGHEALIDVEYDENNTEGQTEKRPKKIEERQWSGDSDTTIGSYARINIKLLSSAREVFVFESDVEQNQAAVAECSDTQTIQDIPENTLNKTNQSEGQRDKNSTSSKTLDLKDSGINTSVQNTSCKTYESEGQGIGDLTCSKTLDLKDSEVNTSVEKDCTIKIEYTSSEEQDSNVPCHKYINIKDKKAVALVVKPCRVMLSKEEVTKYFAQKIKVEPMSPAVAAPSHEELKTQPTVVDEQIKQQEMLVPKIETESQINPPLCQSDAKDQAVETQILNSPEHGESLSKSRDKTVEMLEAERGAVQMLEAERGAVEMLEAERGAVEMLEAERGAVEMLEAERGAVEMLEAGRGAVQMLEAERGAVEMLEAGRGAVEMLEAERGAVQMLEAERGAVEMLEAERGAVEMLEAGRGAVQMLEAGRGAAEMLEAEGGAAKIQEAAVEAPSDKDVCVIEDRFMRCVPEDSEVVCVSSEDEDVAETTLAVANILPNSCAQDVNSRSRKRKITDDTVPYEVHINSSNILNLVPTASNVSSFNKDDVNGQKSKRKKKLSLSAALSFNVNSTPKISNVISLAPKSQRISTSNSLNNVPILESHENLKISDIKSLSTIETNPFQNPQPSTSNTNPNPPCRLFIFKHSESVLPQINKSQSNKVQPFPSVFLPTDSNVILKHSESVLPQINKSQSNKVQPVVPPTESDEHGVFNKHLNKEVIVSEHAPVVGTAATPPVWPGRKRSPLHIQCTKCSNVFANQYDFSIHMNMHSKVPDLYAERYCKLCQVNYTNCCSFTLHTTIVHNKVMYLVSPVTELGGGVFIYKCAVCLAAFTDRNLFYIHCNPYVDYLYLVLYCDVCDIRFPNVKTYKDHVVETHQSNFCFKCSLCPLRYLSYNELRHHVLKSHNCECIFCRNCNRDIPVPIFTAAHVKRCVAKDGNSQCPFCDVHTKEQYSEINVLNHFNEGHVRITCRKCLNVFFSLINFVCHKKKFHSSDFASSSDHYMLVLKQGTMKNILANIKTSIILERSAINGSVIRDATRPVISLNPSPSGIAQVNHISPVLPGAKQFRVTYPVLLDAVPDLNQPSNIVSCLRNLEKTANFPVQSNLTLNALATNVVRTQTNYSQDETSSSSDIQCITLDLTLDPPSQTEASLTPLPQHKEVVFQHENSKLNSQDETSSSSDMQFVILDSPPENEASLTPLPQHKQLVFQNEEISQLDSDETSSSSDIECVILDPPPQNEASSTVLFAAHSNVAFQHEKSNHKFSSTILQNFIFKSLLKHCSKLEITVQCKICKQIFVALHSDISKLKTHFAKHTLKDIFDIPCLYCGLNLANIDDLERHIKMFHKACKLCHFKYDTDAEYNEHKERHKLGVFAKYVCPCTEEFQNLEFCVAHYKEKHRVSTNKLDKMACIRVPQLLNNCNYSSPGLQFSCFYCNKAIDSFAKLIPHINEKHGVYQCLQCLKYVATQFWTIWGNTFVDLDVGKPINKACKHCKGMLPATEANQVEQDRNVKEADTALFEEEVKIDITENPTE